MAETALALKPSDASGFQVLSQSPWPSGTWQAIWIDRQAKMTRHRYVFQKNLNRLMWNLETEVRDNLRRGWAGDDTAIDDLVLFDNDSWLERYKDRMLPVALQTILGGGSVGMADVSSAERFVLQPSDWIWAGGVVQDASAKKLASIDRAIRKDLRKLLDQDQEQEDIDSALAKLVRSHLTGRKNESMAVSETAGTFHYGVQASYQRTGVSRKVWLTSLRDNVRPSHQAMHGQEVSIGEPFISGAGNYLQYPGDRSAPAGDWANCYCVIMPA